MMTDMGDESNTGAPESDDLSSARRIKIALIAVGIFAGLVLLYFMFRGQPILEDAETAVMVAEPEPEAAAPLDAVWLAIERIPADLIDEDGAVIGSVFIDVGLAVGDAADELYLSEHLVEVRLAILRALASEGIGRQDEPLKIDRERVADMIIVAANQALGRAVVIEVSVPKSLSGG